MISYDNFLIISFLSRETKTGPNGVQKEHLRTHADSFSPIPVSFLPTRWHQCAGISLTLSLHLRLQVALVWRNEAVQETTSPEPKAKGLLIIETKHSKITKEIFKFKANLV